ncbi:hypothetical protein [uncultured Clostridium sp.]|nr:hypothetical protein [uncultured Clostridium sp.]
MVVYNATNIDNYDVNFYVPNSKTGYWHVIANHKLAGLNALGKVECNNIPKLKSYSTIILYNK